MKKTPVKDLRQPAYPTRREMLAGAVSFVLINLVGGEGASADEKQEGITVAPVFEHGEGRGATGCVVVSPPVFLSEEEGMQIIREELAKHGIQLRPGEILKGVRFSPKREQFVQVEREGGRTGRERSVVEIPGQSKPLKLDGVDSDTKVGVEFVSREDYFALGGVMSGTTVQSYRILDVVREVTETVQKQAKGDVFLGVFYDPLIGLPLQAPPNGSPAADWKAARTERQERSKEEAQRLLRKQTQDFAGWLKKQKAIP